MFSSSQRKPRLLFATVRPSDALNSASLIIGVDGSPLKGVIYPSPQVLLFSQSLYYSLMHECPTFVPLALSFFFGCGILVPQPGIEPAHSAVKVQSPNHWTSREFLLLSLHSCD